MATATREIKELVIDGVPSSSVVQGILDLWAYREVVWAFTERAVRLKYKQAVLGIGWVLIQPLAFLAIFSLIFHRMAQVSGPVEVPYAAFALSALIPWLFVQTSIAFGAQSLVMDSVLARKVYFPREIPVIGAVLSCSVDLAIGLALLLALAPFIGLHLSWKVALVLPLYLMLTALAMGIAIPVAALNVYYRDFRYAIPLMLQLWMFASPVVYPLAAVPKKWHGLYLVLNPDAAILDGFRQALTRGHLDLRDLGISAITVTLIAWGGYTVFKRIERGIADAV
jgi:lipopolysaccharide transport system permease protein